MTMRELFLLINTVFFQNYTNLVNNLSEIINNLIISKQKRAFDKFHTRVADTNLF